MEIDILHFLKKVTPITKIYDVERLIKFTRLRKKVNKDIIQQIIFNKQAQTTKINIKNSLPNVLYRW
jgi:hypothetical protein